MSFEFFFIFIVMSYFHNLCYRLLHNMYPSTRITCIFPKTPMVVNIISYWDHIKKKKDKQFYSGGKSSPQGAALNPVPESVQLESWFVPRGMEKFFWQRLFSSPQFSPTSVHNKFIYATWFKLALTSPKAEWITQSLGPCAIRTKGQRATDIWIF